VNPNTYALLGLTAIIGAVSATIVFAMLRFIGAARDARKQSLAPAGENALLASALADAVAKLRTQERATAARAEASERLSEEIISSLTSGLLVVSLRGEVRIINPAGRRLLRIGEAQVIGEDYRKVIGEPALSQVIDECLASRTAVVRRTVHLPEDSHGGASRFGVTVSPLFDASGVLNGAVCLFTDLTAVQQLEEQLRLKESLARVGELTAGIAHEFRNGLATIHGYGKLFDLNQLPEAYRPYVEGIRQETESLKQIVTNFLNFARPAQLTLTDVDLRAICERVADEQRQEARTLGGDIVVRGRFGRLQGDDVLLRQAFSNLLRNAIEACAAESIAPVVVIESEIDAARGMSRISVEDNGPGIDPAMRERVFQPFFTLKRTGTGLGLALVQKIVVFHNGRIAITESDQGGACIQVHLPVAAAQRVSA
jgi:PAS domain S-box-containing protein